MTYLFAILAMIVFADVAAAEPATQCDAPDSLISTDADLPHAIKEIKANQRLDITVIGTGSSALSGPDGASYAYPARLEAALKELLPGYQFKVTAHVESRQTTADMVTALKKVLGDDKPSLVIWQAGTSDALSGIEPDDFRWSLDAGVEQIQASGADVILMNMQYSPRTEAMLDVSSYADVMHWVAEQRGALLFDRFGIMHYWNDNGVFDLYTATKDYDMARRVHECVARALAAQIIGATHLDAVRVQRTP